MSFEALILTQANSEIGGILAEVINRNPDEARRAAQRGAEFFRRLVTRSLKSTGYQLKAAIESGIKTNAYNVSPLRRYPPTGAVMATTIRRYFHGGKSTQPYIRYKNRETYLKRQQFADKNPGMGFARLMNYFVNADAAANTLKVGALPRAEGGKAGQYWIDIFSEWQEAGEVNVNYRGTQGKRGLHGFLGAIGMPIRAATILQRPERKIVQTAQETENPEALFQAKFEERLLRK